MSGTRMSFLPHKKPHNPGVPTRSVGGTAIVRPEEASLLAFSPDPAPSYSWVLQISKSLSSMGESAGTSIKKWWQVGWGWILSHKPGFAKDPEIKEEENSTKICGSGAGFIHHPATDKSLMMVALLRSVNPLAKLDDDNSKQNNSPTVASLRSTNLAVATAATRRLLWGRRGSGRCR